MLEYFLGGIGFLLAAIYWVGCGLVVVRELGDRHEYLSAVMAILAIAPPFFGFMALVAVLKQAGQ